MSGVGAGRWRIRIKPKVVAPGVQYVVYTPEGDQVPYGRYPSVRSAFVRIDSELWKRKEAARHIPHDLPWEPSNIGT
jgi:hypothetical protein